MDFIIDKNIVVYVDITLQPWIEFVLVAMLCLEQRDAITIEDRAECGMCKTEFELTRMEVLTTFLEESICYFCGDVIHNYELVILFDGREVKSCFDCYATVEIAKAVYYCKVSDVDIQWGF